jgi:hypothetical protein
MKTTNDLGVPARNMIFKKDKNKGEFSMKSLNKVIATYFLLTGLSILLFWTIALPTGNVPDIEVRLVMMSFHVFSEYSLALISIITAIGLFAEKVWAKEAFFFAGGMAICSITNAGYVYYYDETIHNPAMVVMFVVLLTISVIFAGYGYLKYSVPENTLYKTTPGNYKLYLLSTGILIYVLINIGGTYAQNFDWGMFSMIILSLLFSVFFLVTTVRSVNRGRSRKSSLIIQPEVAGTTSP